MAAAVGGGVVARAVGQRALDRARTWWWPGPGRGRARPGGPRGPGRSAATCRAIPATRASRARRPAFLARRRVASASAPAMRTAGPAAARPPGRRRGRRATGGSSRPCPSSAPRPASAPSRRASSAAGSPWRSDSEWTIQQWVSPAGRRPPHRADVGERRGPRAPSASNGSGAAAGSSSRLVTLARTGDHRHAGRGPPSSVGRRARSSGPVQLRVGRCAPRSAARVCLRSPRSLRGPQRHVDVGRLGPQRRRPCTARWGRRAKGS